MRIIRGMRALRNVYRSAIGIRLSIEPKTVSFRGIKVGEIPCNEEDVIEDYFNTPNFRGSRTHSGLAGSWLAKRIDECDNYWTYDLAGRDGPYTGWSAGRLVWKVPIGWFRLVSDSDNYNGHQYWEPESERYGDTSSRPLLIGGTQDAYKQVFQIYEDGSSSVSKFGRWVRRSRWGVLSKNWQ